MMMNPIKTKILTLSVAVALGLGGLTFLVSGNGLNLGGSVVTRNTHLELMQLNVLDDASTSLSEQNPQVEMKMQGDTLVSAVSDGKKEILVSNKLTGDASAFGGQGNSITGTTSIVLGGSGNTLSEAYSFIGGSQASRADAKADVILASSGVNLSGEDSVVMASENIKGTARELIALSAEGATSSADRSLLVGPNIEVRNTGVFAFNAKKREKLTSQKDHSVLINADRGLIINANSTPDNVLLKVNGGVKLAHDLALDTTGAVIYANKCMKLKAVGAGEGISIDCAYTNPLPSDDLLPKCGVNATTYTASDTRWKEDSEKGFCGTGTPEYVGGLKPQFTQKASAQGTFASAGFSSTGYAFAICFNENDPLCKAQQTTTWRCKMTDASGLQASKLCEAKIQEIKKPEAPKTVMCKDPAGFDANSTNITRKQVAPNADGSAPLCETSCKPGYSLHNNRCAKLEWKCDDVVESGICRPKALQRECHCTITKPARPGQSWQRVWTSARDLAVALGEPYNYLHDYGSPCEAPVSFQQAQCSWAPTSINTIDQNICNNLNQVSCQGNSKCTRDSAGGASLQIGVGKAICKDDKGNVFPESSCSHLTKPTTCGGASSPIGGSGVSVSTRATEMLIAVNCAMGLEKIEYSIQGQEQTSPLSVDYKYTDRYFVKTPIKEGELRNISVLLDQGVSYTTGKKISVFPGDNRYKEEMRKDFGLQTNSPIHLYSCNSPSVIGVTNP